MPRKGQGRSAAQQAKRRAKQTEFFAKKDAARQANELQQQQQDDGDDFMVKEDARCKSASQSHTSSSDSEKTCSTVTAKSRSRAEINFQARGPLPEGSMADFTASNSLHEYFDSPKHSDVTLCFGTHEIKAHKVVLSQASDCLRATLESEPREAKSPLLTLEEDDPRTVKGMISWIYGLHRDGNGDLSRLKPTVACTPAGFNYVIYSIDLYVTASNYLVTDLQHFIATDFRGNLSTLAQTSDFSSYIDQVSRHVYLRHAEAAKPLRAHVLGIVAAIFRRLDSERDIEPFKKLMLDVPELSWDLLLKMGRDNEEWRMLASRDG